MRFIYTKAFIRAFALFAAIALLIILDALGLTGIAKSAFSKTYGSVSTRTSSATDNLKQFFATIFTIKNLVKENALLNQKIDELSYENAKLQSAKVENLALRKALKFEEPQGFEHIAAEVKVSDPTGFSQIMIIDKGRSAGVALGAAVITAPGVLVGKVSKVFNSTSEVTLITDPEVVVNAEVAESAARGLVRGDHGLGLVFGLITQNEVIKVQDRVVTSGLSGDFPKGLLIGEISSVREAKSQLFQEAFVTPAADLKNLKFLFVIKL